MEQCSACGTRGAALLRCSRCRDAWFCDPACQRAGWPTHKLSCQPSPVEPIATQTTEEDACTAATLEWYSAHAEEELERSISGAASVAHVLRGRARKTMISCLGSHTRRRILDVGCGPGRDLRALREEGHDPVGLEGAPRLCDVARDHSGCPVVCGNIHTAAAAMGPSPAPFDGVLANNSLYFLPSRHLPAALHGLHSLLRPGGVLCTCNPCSAPHSPLRAHSLHQAGMNGVMGEGVEQRDQQTKGVHVVYPPAQWKALVADAGFTLLKEFRFSEQHDQNTSIEYLITAWKRPGDLTASALAPQQQRKAEMAHSSPQYEGSAWSAAALQELLEDTDQPAPPSHTSTPVAPSTLHSLLQRAVGSTHPALHCMETWLQEEGLGELQSLLALVKSGDIEAQGRLEDAGFRPAWAASIVSQLNSL